MPLPAKQRHTAKRIFERLRDEHGYGGGYTMVKDYVRVRRQQRREVFVPLRHPAGHGQADFGEAVAVIGGVPQKVHLFVMDLPQSDAGFVKAYPAETTEAFLDGRVSAFAFFGGMPRSILYSALIRTSSTSSWTLTRSTPRPVRRHGRAPLADPRSRREP
jgi:transposase